MDIKALTFPSTLVISLADAKAHLRVTDTNQDAVIADCIKSATGLIEKYTNQLLTSRTFVAYLNYSEFQAYCPIQIWSYPVTAISSVKYLDTNGTEQTFSSANYSTNIADSPAEILPTTTPTVQQNVLNPYRVYFTAGFTDVAQIDPELIGWVKIFTAFFYQTRQPEYTGYSVAEIAYKYERALDKYRKDMII